MDQIKALIAALPPQLTEQLAALAAAYQAQAAANPFLTGAATALAAMMVLRAVLPSFNTAVDNVSTKSNNYTDLHNDKNGDKTQDRVGRAQEMVNYYYDLATDFYEYGWGDSFHFAHRYKTESQRESILRHEYYLASQIGLKPGMTCMDLGCGIGGPARNIARFSGAKITGVNNNAYQIKRANIKTEKEEITNLVSFQKGDFMNLPFAPESYDAAYAIEATCHAPDRTACFTQIFKALKPGAVFAGYEWVTTDKFDATNPAHLKLKKEIEVGDGLPDITNWRGVRDALIGAGFELDTVYDLAESSPVPWYKPFQASWTIEGFKSTWVGFWMTHVMVWLLEALWLSPKGTTQMHAHLIAAARGLSAGGETQTFTPMLFFKARKPAAGKAASAASPVKTASGASEAKSTARGRSKSKSR